MNMKLEISHQTWIFLSHTLLACFGRTASQEMFPPSPSHSDLASVLREALLKILIYKSAAVSESLYLYSSTAMKIYGLHKFKYGNVIFVVTQVAVFNSILSKYRVCGMKPSETNYIHHKLADKNRHLSQTRMQWIWQAIVDAETWIPLLGHILSNKVFITITSDWWCCFDLRCIFLSPHNPWNKLLFSSLWKC